MNRRSILGWLGIAPAAILSVLKAKPSRIISAHGAGRIVQTSAGTFEYPAFTKEICVRGPLVAVQAQSLCDQNFTSQFNQRPAA